MDPQPRRSHTARIRKKGTKKERKEGIQDINTYTNTNLIPSRRFCSAHYPITHKALITQLISIYLITPSLPGTISIGSGRESLPPRIPHPCYPIFLTPHHSSPSLSLYFRSFSQIVDTPLLFAFLQNANHSCGRELRMYHGFDLIETIIVKKTIDRKLQIQISLRKSKSLNSS